METFRVLIALTLVASAAASGCPNKCSGHGACELGDKCACQPLWVGNDCSQRECAYGLSWVTSMDTTAAPAGTFADGEGLGGRHLYAECSDKGKCDRSTGECQCYEGYEGKGCRRQKCPSDCSGHGMCVYNQILNPNYSPQGFAINDPGADIAPSHFIEFGSQYWDKMKTRSCVCDRGFEGTDCADRTCPSGDDPLTDCNGVAHMNEIQILNFNTDHFEVSQADLGAAAGFFTLTFMDMFGANYTTRPIELPHEAVPAGTTNSPDLFQKTADDIEDALEALPNFAIPNVTVTVLALSSTDPHATPVFTTSTDVVEYVMAVEFVDEANAGPQNTLQCSYATPNNGYELSTASPYNYGASQPRFVAPTHASATEVCTAFQKPLAAGEDYKEHVQCSNRGACDGSTGLCSCYEGFTGEACSTQTVFF